MVTICFSSAHMLFLQVFWAFIHGFFFLQRERSYVHYSPAKFTGEWFTNHSNHIRIFTPITRKVATKAPRYKRSIAEMVSSIAVGWATKVSSRLA